MDPMGKNAILDQFQTFQRGPTSAKAQGFHEGWSFPSHKLGFLDE